MKTQHWKAVRAKALADGRISEKRVAELKATGRVREQWARATAGPPGVPLADESSGRESQESQDAAADESNRNLIA